MTFGIIDIVVRFTLILATAVVEEGVEAFAKLVLAYVELHTYRFVPRTIGTHFFNLLFQRERVAGRDVGLVRNGRRDSSILSRATAKFAELLGEVVTDSTKKNLEMRVEAENGATLGKFELAKRAKEENLDAIHDTVHEMARDEARHGRAFEGLLKRYFGK